MNKPGSTCVTDEIDSKNTSECDCSPYFIANVMNCLISSNPYIINKTGWLLMDFDVIIYYFMHNSNCEMNLSMHNWTILQNHATVQWMKIDLHVSVCEQALLCTNIYSLIFMTKFTSRMACAVSTATQSND